MVKPGAQASLNGADGSENHFRAGVGSRNAPLKAGSFSPRSNRLH